MGSPSPPVLSSIFWREHKLWVCRAGRKIDVEPLLSWCRTLAMYFFFLTFAGLFETVCCYFSPRCSLLVTCYCFVECNLSSGGPLPGCPPLFSLKRNTQYRLVPPFGKDSYVIENDLYVRIRRLRYIVYPVFLLWYEWYS
jgi:hypothetical protein